MYLFDDDGNVAMLNGDKLEPFYTCPECGHEGFRDEMAHELQGPGCLEYLQQIGVAQEVE